MFYYFVDKYGISTHTLTWSVTAWIVATLQLFFNFNSHAHVERDLSWLCQMIYLKHFNSHAHVERDISAPCKTVSEIISTHTLTWSVTFINFPTHITYKISTHTLTWSVTRILRQQGSNWKFQLTRSRGAWLQRWYGANCWGKFQLTRSRGAWRKRCKRTYIFWKISTHTLTWSVTQQPPIFWQIVGFQLTRSRGAWHCFWRKRMDHRNFNSHAHVERDE